MIEPKATDRRTRAQLQRDENEAYELCVLRDQNRCVRCGRRDHTGLQRDHRKNRSQGGPTIVSNLQLFCLDCHRWKTEHPRSAVMEGFAIPGWPTANPTTWPARRVLRLDIVTRAPFLAPCLYREDGAIDWISAGEYVDTLRTLGITGVS